MKSNLFKLKLRDAIKGAILAIGSPLLYAIQESIPGWNISSLQKMALSVFITYIIKQFFTDDIKVAHETLQAAAKSKSGEKG